MKHSIDPKVDCVFKAVLGSEKNKNLLINFLNAILAKELKQPIASVDIINPYNEKEFINDKMSIVDIKASDAQGRLFQIEIQLSNYPDLPARIVYNWADIFSQQLESGEKYGVLKPTYSIWLLNENLIKDDQNYVHHFKLQDTAGRVLSHHGGIWLLELNKFNTETVNVDEQRWLKFFKEGGKLNDEALPDWMCTNEMRQAMNTLKGFSEKQQDYFKYQARQEFLREQRSIQSYADKSKQEAEVAKQETEVAKQETEVAKQELKELKQVTIEREQAALEEIERLKALLKNSSTQ